MPTTTGDRAEHRDRDADPERGSVNDVQLTQHPWRYNHKQARTPYS